LLDFFLFLVDRTAAFSMIGCWLVNLCALFAI